MTSQEFTILREILDELKRIRMALEKPAIYEPRKMSEARYDLRIHRNPDAMAWAKFFTETTKDMGREAFRDEGYMVAWFANAMMAMHDHLMLGSAPINGDHAQEIINGNAYNQNQPMEQQRYAD